MPIKFPVRSNDKIRIGALQYFIRPIQRFDQFVDQVTALVETAADYRCGLVVFPEYFTTQLLTLGDVRRPMDEQVRDLSTKLPQFIDLMGGLARKFGIYLAAGTIPAVEDHSDVVRNRSFFFGRRGEFGTQDKLHMTRFETEEWKVSPGSHLTLFETDFGLVATTICYDVEFPELARVAAREGALVLLAPSCTDDRQGFLRVRYCAHARAIENQMYVVHASTVGSLPMVPAVSLNYGLASIMNPSDFPFARDGVLAEGVTNQEMMVIGDVDLQTVAESRRSGTVLPLRDSEHSSTVVSKLETVTL
jgi:predicted amidohydrolase